MNVTLMHKNIPVADLVLDGESGFIEKIGYVHDPTRLPIGTAWYTGAEKGKPERRRLNDWWVGRSIPASRDNIQAALLKMHVLQTTELLSKCYGLSLSDQYWVCPEDSGLSWEDVNFFDNLFSTDVGDILFGHEPQTNACVNLMSPDNTSDGWLQKKWVIYDDKRLLMKSGSGPYQQEPFNELIACAIMKRLNVPHVPYTLTIQNNLPYSLCETFVTTQTELVPAWRIAQVLPKNNHDSAFTHLLRCADALGIPHVQPALEKMLVVDYIIANTDRHYNNFGFVRDADTLEWHGLAPIYDSGTSLWHDSQFINRGIAKSKPFRPAHTEQIKLVQDFRWYDTGALQDLRDECTEILSKSEYINEDRRIAIVQAIENRCHQIP